MGRHLLASHQRYHGDPYDQRMVEYLGGVQETIPINEVNDRFDPLTFVRQQREAERFRTPDDFNKVSSHLDLALCGGEAGHFLVYLHHSYRKPFLDNAINANRSRQKRDAPVSFS